MKPISIVTGCYDEEENTEKRVIGPQREVRLREFFYTL